MKFSDLQFDSTLQAAIDKLGYPETTPIQTEVFPLILNGQDVSGLAQTGTGKTAAFVVPLMERILRARPLPETATAEEKELAQKRAFPDWKPQDFILVLVPTRELAEQVCENVQRFSEFSGIKSVSVYGGTSYDKQKEALQSGVEFVVATPGRLIDLYKEHAVDLKWVRGIVFDEADRMFDMGFKDDMKYILQRVPRERQFLVFSATLNFDVLNTAYMFGAEPVEINISRDQAKAENVKDEIFHVGHDDKPMYLLSLLRKHNPKQVIVFSNFKMSVERIASFLSANGLPAMAISSLLSQAQRNRVIEQFKSENEKNILVATDVAARGLDIKGVDMVINVELPQDAESYVHRIGRTGRAGTEGTAFSLVCDRDVDSLSRIEDYLKHKVNVAWLDDADMVKDFKPPTNESSYEGRSENRGEGRGPRPEGRRGGPPDRGADRGGAGRPPRAGGPHRPGDNRGPRRDQRPPQGSGGAHRPAAAGGAGPAKHQNGAAQSHAGARPPRAGGHSNAPHKNRGPGSNAQGPHRKGPPHQRGSQAGARPAARAAQGKTQQPAGVMQKVSGFFKKIFGSDAKPTSGKNS